MKNRIYKISKNILEILIVYILIIVVSVCVYFLIDNYLINMQASSNTYEEYMPTGKDDNISYKKLKAINKEVVGWIKIPDTNINYPIVQAEDNKKYLTTNPLNQYSSCGSIFIDCNCKGDFSGFNTIIYGHHMANGLMFGDLDKYNDKKFFDNHRNGTVFVDDDKYKIKFYAFIDDIDGYDSNIYKVVGDDIGERGDYLKYIRSKSKYLVNYDEINNVVLLSTCNGYETNGRMLLVGYLVR